jgi:photosystem II stability/assembly factor-like uncharacterized protein
MSSWSRHEPVRRRVVLLSSAVTAAAVAALAGCSPAGEPRAEPAAPASPDGRQAPGHLGDGVPTEGAALPSPHVHAVAIDPADGRVLLATHEGLFRYDDAGSTRVGPVIDLMGFTVAGPGHFYASGHPGPGVDLPQPVGLIESTDGGQSWSPVSRQGQSDFHALTASSAGVIGFDGAALLATSDGRRWRELHPPVAPYALAAAPDGAVLLATAASGPVRSTDAGATWAPVEGAPLLQVVDWAEGQTVAGVTPEGTIAVSDDAGATWTERAGVGGPPQAVAASPLPDGSLRVLVVSADAILDSRDGGASLTPFDGA